MYLSFYDCTVFIKLKGMKILHKIYIDTHKWKKKLNKAIIYSQETNIPDLVLEKIAKSIINFTISTTSPDTESERLFFNMWKKADNKEKKVLTKMLIKIIKE